MPTTAVWPAPGEVHLRRLLKHMNVDVSGIQTGDLTSLQEVFARALTKLQGTSSRLWRALDPSSMSICKGMDIRAAFWDHFTEKQLRYLLLRGKQAAPTVINAFLSWREQLALLAYHYCGPTKLTDEFKDAIGLAHAKEPPFLMLIIYLKGIKLTSMGTPLLEVHYICLQEKSQEEIFKLVVQTHTALISKRTPSDCMNCPSKVLELMLVKEVLSANAAKLSPEYKQRCKSEWGLEGTAHEVSFLVPQRPLTAEQSEDLQALCANDCCNRPGSLRCSRCKGVRYCSKLCQSIHWQQAHKQACRTARTAGAATS